MVARKTGRKIKHTARGWRHDQKRRSKQSWERGSGAKRKGNPNYMARFRRTSKGLRKVYILRQRSTKSKKRSKGRGTLLTPRRH